MTHRISPKITERQHHIIVGTILGGSSIIKPKRGKNCYLSMRSKNIEWLGYKAGELRTFSSQDPITIEKTNRWHSICYPVFNTYRETFYSRKNNRYLTTNTLDELCLRDTAFAIWFGDCGKFDGKTIVFNTHVWKQKGSRAIAKYFGLLGYEAKVFTERDNYRVKLDRKSSNALYQIIEPQLPYFYFTHREKTSPNPDQEE